MLLIIVTVPPSDPEPDIGGNNLGRGEFIILYHS